MDKVINFMSSLAATVKPAYLLAVIFVLALIYIIITKIRDKKAVPEASAAPAKQAQSSAKAPATAANVSTGTLDLIDTDEKTAAVIMALVSNKSGIPLNRLSFKSIRLMEDK